MNERYTKLYTLPQQTAPGDLHIPVEISAGALLRDNQTGTVLAQIKYKNIFSKSIKSMRVNIHAQDVSGVRIGSVKEFTYQGIVAAPGDFFGDKMPVTMTDNNSHSFFVDIVAVEFSDGSTWKKGEQEAPKASEAAPKTPLSALDILLLIGNGLVSLILLVMWGSFIMDFIAKPSARGMFVVGYMAVEQIIAFPFIDRVVFRKMNPFVRRLLRWGIFIAVYILSAVIAGVLF